MLACTVGPAGILSPRVFVVNGVISTIGNVVYLIADVKGSNSTGIACCACCATSSVVPTGKLPPCVSGSATAGPAKFNWLNALDLTFCT